MHPDPFSQGSTESRAIKGQYSKSHSSNHICNFKFPSSHLKKFFKVKLILITFKISKISFQHNQ